MRKNLFLLALVTMLSPLCASAGTVVVNGITFSICDGQANPTLFGPGYYAAVIQSKNDSYSGIIDIPESVEYTDPFHQFNNKYTVPVLCIDTDAFKDCENITSIRIPKSIICLDRYHSYSYGYSDDGLNLSGCTSLEEIIIDKDNKVFDSRENCNCVIGKNDNAIYAGCKNSFIPGTARVIRRSAFEGCGLSSIDIPSSIGSIGEYAFRGSSLKSVTLQSFNEAYGNGIFKDCKELTDVYSFSKLTNIPDCYARFKMLFDEDNNITLHVNGVDIEGYRTGLSSFFKNIVAIAGTESVYTYKLTYMVDGEVYETFDVNEGESITPESEPTKEGYTFSGWSEIPSTMPGENVTVYGTFTVNKYKLTYMIDGTEYKTIEVEYGSTITPEDNPTMDGYNFSGWSDIPDTMPASDVVVTGSFSKGSYTLTYILDGVTYKTYTYGYDESITPESVPDKEGYTFTGWDNLPETMPGHDVTVTGSYTINKYNLIYMVDGEVYMTIEVEYGASIIPEEEPTKDGYVFSGWSWIPSKMPAEDVTVSGTFKRVGYNVSDNIYIIEGNEATFAMTNVTSGDLIISPTIVVNNTTYNVTSVAGYSCMNNTGITSVTIPDGVAVIGDNAFYGCTGVKSLSLGKDIGYIGNIAFAYIGTSASARKRASSEPLVIECHAESVPDVQNDSFEGIDMENAILKVNDDLVDAYKNLYPWSQFTNIVGFNASTGFNSIYSEKNGDSIFSIDGRRIDKPQKGMNIIRTSQGTRKVMVK